MGGVFRVARLGGFVERVIHKVMVYTFCLFRVLCRYVGGQMEALKSGVGECSEVARFNGLACPVSLEVSA